MASIAYELDQRLGNSKLYALFYELLPPLSCLLSEHEIAALNQMSWLMKTASIELRVTSLNRQRSHTQRLLHLLLDDIPVKSYLGKWSFW